jgi:GNAT superfamily N-acetyltransferase
MWWRLTQAQFSKQAGEQNKQALKGIVDAGNVPGLLAYAEDQPIAWCSLGPREVFPALNRSRRFKRVDMQPVWAIVCFFVAKPYRGRGIMVPMLRAALDYAARHGAEIVEGYPIDPPAALTGYAGYMGVVPAFREVRFVEVLRRTPHQPIMRYYVTQGVDAR